MQLHSNTQKHLTEITRRFAAIGLINAVALGILTPTRALADLGDKTMTPTQPAVPAGETFNGTWPFKALYTQSAGYQTHYVDEGNGPETLLLLHGEPTWSYLFRHQISAWSKRYRVVAIDHMGFGKSAAPQDRTYWLQDHIDNLENVIIGLDLRDITMVMHDFGGPTGMGLAIRHPDRIKRIVSINGPTPAGQPDLVDRLIANAGLSPWFQWIMKAEQDGVLEQVLGQLDYTMLSTLKLNGFEDNTIITDDWLQAYSAPFPSPDHSVGAIGWAKGFAIGAHTFEQPDKATQVALSRKPALAIWGEEDQTLRASQFLPLFTQAFPRGQIVQLPNTGHYSPEDAPTDVTNLVKAFVSS